MKVVILSGGSGSRLWPVSRESYPKQFCEFFDQSFLRTTIERLQPFGPPRIVTLESMSTLTQSALSGAGVGAENILLEPLPKNTAAAIALVTHLALLDGTADEVLGVFPADHLIVDTPLFQKTVKWAEEVARGGSIVTVGIVPSYPSTGYGYLEVDPESAITKETLSAYKVKRFSEKPTVAKAEEFARGRRHYWNAGIFFFTAKAMAALLAQHMPELWKKIISVQRDLSNLKYVYANLTAQSIDYGIMEKVTDSLICIPGNFGWSDVGSWDELARLQEEKLSIDSHANVFGLEANENFVYSNHEKVIGLAGVSGLIVVDTPDALLVTKRGESQSVKKLVEMMREARLPEVAEHNFELRPWGRFEVLSDKADHKVKRIFIEPGKRLSYQIHKQRDEHWTVISGRAEVLLDDKLEKFGPGEQIYVPRGRKHRLQNSGPDLLTVIEVQTGQYFGEDDIIRLADDFDRS